MHEFFMEQALDAAYLGKYQTYKNPLVGAVITKNEQVLSIGFHRGFGKMHAEIDAIRQIKNQKDIRGATMYVTLEPCSHYGKQPPCMNKITELGIKEIYIAQLDPNPLVHGKGAAYLESHGIQVHVGLLNDKARKLNHFYTSYYENKRPFIQLKMAQSLDGRLSLSSKLRTSLTGKEALADVQRERAQFQSILVGSQTVLTDNPKLTVRDRNLPYPPVRIILDRRGFVQDESLFIFSDDSTETWIFTSSSISSKIINLPHVKIFYREEWTLQKTINVLYQEGIQSCYVEGGAAIHDSFLQADLWDRQSLYLAPKLIGGTSLSSFYSKRVPTSTKEVRIKDVDIMGTDIKLTIEKEEVKCLQA